MKKMNKQISKMKPAGLILLGATALCFAFMPYGGGGGVWTAPTTANSKKNPIAANEKSIAAGKTLYTASCTDCHGKKGKGDGSKAAELDKSPQDFNSAEFQKQTDGAIFYKITEGRKPMPAFKKDLTEEQRWLVVNYIRTFGKK